MQAYTVHTVCFAQDFFHQLNLPFIRTFIVDIEMSRIELLPGISIVKNGENPGGDINASTL